MNDAILFGPKSTASRRYEHVRRWRATLKRRLVICFGGRCGVCNLVDHDVVYDFHHRDPANKNFQPTAKIRAWPKVVAEMQKCVMVCSHCHRKIHSGLIAIPDDAPVFDETLVAKSDFALYAGPVMDNCPVCGGQKDAVRKACSVKCAGSLRTSALKPRDLIALSETVKLRGYTAPAKEIGVSDNTIRKWFRSADIEPPRIHKWHNRAR